MQIAAARPLIFGVTYFCLFRTVFSSIASSTTCETQKKMSTTSASKQEPTSYVPGSSSMAFITTPDEDSARKLARSLVESRLAACVNIFPRITSIYIWDDKLVEDNECVLIVKTRTSRVNDLSKYVRDNHNYSVAEVISLPIENGNPPYLDWIQRTVPDAK